ncbi:DUF4870 domain-containing protein [Haloplasma contractile]|uniref:Tic20-like protein n=1 Tax=Haloplasma contractile SSD-17B TaxID=1033810 RepID=U2EF79_9MOLU|nr:DUF4870 domain-containing protein [Haloplasma contractile]ERJ13336.1 Tic20-like protein [Haloplasma contractile SSD-17B]
MAEEFKFNEKTGMYEIVKKDKNEKDQNKNQSGTNTENRYGAERDYNTTDRFDPKIDTVEHGNQQKSSIETNQQGSNQRKNQESCTSAQPTRTNSTNQTYTRQSHTRSINQNNNNTESHSNYHSSSHSHPYNTPSSEYDENKANSKQSQGNSHGNQSGHQYNQSQNRRSNNGIEEILENDQTMGTLVWVGTMVGAFVLNIFFIVIPLVFYVLYEKKSEFVRAHSKEALNVSISFIIYGLGFTVAGFMLSGILMVVNPFFMLGTVSTIISILLVSVYGLVVGIQGAMAANKNELYRAPLTIRFLK